MKNKFKLPITFIICIGLWYSCSNNNQIKQESESIMSDSIISVDSTQIEIDIKTNRTDTSSHETKQKVQPPIPDYYDFQSEVHIYYKSYVGKAYDFKSHQKYFGTRNQNKLDSLIKEYDKNKDLEDSQQRNQ